MSADELNETPQELVVDEVDSGARLDAYLAKVFPKYSRMQLRRIIGAGGVRVNNAGTKVSHRLHTGNRVSIFLPQMPTAGPNPENIPLHILFEDDQLLAINKPPAMVVHPSRGHWSGTLTSALAFHFDQLSTAGGAHRPGIVHRLDRDTSGVMVVAKNDTCHFALAEQFADRTTAKEYIAITVGAPDRDRDMIDKPIGIHPYQREKMAIRSGHETSREAQTFYEVQERFRGFAIVKMLPKTGRTHQIRVHLSHIGHPVLCDRLYGGRADIKRGEFSGDLTDQEIVLGRQALHAHRIQIRHPISKELMEFVAPIPADMQGTIDVLRELRKR
ncbi:RluA family pseudouridine synthase [Anatilimnocola floriformis]|uniref:RluA family pseudouridine synthase n=1 Tax=Anatilimnocola floriformis TaxID=2948575 RepID=UPI0020C370F4|nr:RluA family pseudouridine synthase [Anatilimnocola floriformis]